MLTSRLLGAVGLVALEEPREVEESVLEVLRVQRLPRLPAGLDDGNQVLLPEEIVAVVDLLDVAEELFIVYFQQQLVRLEVDEACDEQLKVRTTN